MTHDIDTRDAIIADLSARLLQAESTIKELGERVDHVQEESGWWDCAALQAEVERLKAHTWQQERAAVIRLLRSQPCEYEGQVSCYSHLLTLIGHIERGEHWPRKGGEG